MTSRIAEQDSLELKPCPFCGGEANGEGYTRYNRPLADTRWEDGSEITEAFFVNCIKCGVDNGRPGIVGGYQTKAEAIAAWNTRSEADTLSQMREALAPFAKIANHCAYEPDETVLYVHQGIMGDYPLTIGDFRRAALTTTKIEKE